jgi:hypothetical protein
MRVQPSPPDQVIVWASDQELEVWTHRICSLCRQFSPQLPEQRMNAGTNDHASSRTPRHSDTSLVFQLLAYAARTPSATNAGARTLSTDKTIDDRQVKHAVEAGLGPLLHQAIENNDWQLPVACKEDLRRSDVIAQMRHQNLCDAASELLDLCSGIGVAVTLLKGIVVSHLYFPTGHLRPMNDIDILVSRDDLASLERALQRVGYTRMPNYQVDGEAAHGAPFRHPKRGVWVEIHWALFGPSTRLQTNQLFALSTIAANSVPMTFHGQPAYRLAAEFHLAYLASYWIRDLTRNRIHPSFVMGLLDAIYLLRTSGHELDWNALLRQVDNETAMASLYLMLGYLHRRGLGTVPAATIAHLCSHQGIAGTREAAIFDTLFDFYLVGGKRLLGTFGQRHPMIEMTLLDALLAKGSFAKKLLCLPLNLIFPPLVPARYQGGYHLRRLGRLLGRDR